MPGVLGEYLLGRHAEVGEDRPASLRRALSSVSFPVGPGRVGFGAHRAGLLPAADLGTDRAQHDVRAEGRGAGRACGHVRLVSLSLQREDWRARCNEDGRAAERCCGGRAVMRETHSSPGRRIRTCARTGRGGGAACTPCCRSGTSARHGAAGNVSARARGHSSWSTEHTLVVAAFGSRPCGQGPRRPSTATAVQGCGVPVQWAQAQAARPAPPLAA